MRSTTTPSWCRSRWPRSAGAERARGRPGPRGHGRVPLVLEDVQHGGDAHRLRGRQSRRGGGAGRLPHQRRLRHPDGDAGRGGVCAQPLRRAGADHGGRDRPAPSALEADPDREVTVEFHSCSKTFSMAGMRIGFVVGNHDAVEALAAYRTNVGYGTPTVMQAAAAYALNHYAELVPITVAEIGRRRARSRPTRTARSRSSSTRARRRSAWRGCASASWSAITTRWRRWPPTAPTSATAPRR